MITDDCGYNPYEDIYCRDHQVKRIHQLYKLPAIYITGPSSTGKTMVATTVLFAHNSTFIFADAIELYDAKVFFQFILDEFEEKVLREPTPSTRVDHS